MGRADMGQTGESSSGSRFTRSHLQAGPVWTVQDVLILVNEIAAVEGDCQDALSSYQKWNIIAENCTALEVVRNANQCRRKWESLVADYNAVKEWESSSQGNVYWSLEFERRQEIGLPVDFDNDLFKAIDDFMKMTEQANTDTEGDSEDEADSEDETGEVEVLNAGTFGSKPKRAVSHSPPQKNRITGRKQLAVKAEEHEKPLRIVKDMEPTVAMNLNENISTGPKPKRVKLQPTFQRSVGDERKQVSEAEAEKPVPPVIEDMEQMLATKVKEKAELIDAILSGGDESILDNQISELRDEEMLKTERVKCKAEKLVACLTDLAKNLEQLCDVVKEC